MKGKRLSRVLAAAKKVATERMQTAVYGCYSDGYGDAGYGDASYGEGPAG